MPAAPEDAVSRDGRAALVLAAAAHELLTLDRVDLARTAATLALTTGDAQPNCHSVMAGILERLGVWDAALAHWRSAVDLAPGSSGHRHNLAIALMTRDRWPEAADHYDARMDKADWSSLATKGSLDGVRFRLVRSGDPLAGRRIVAFTEQGLGDSIWAARWLTPLAAWGADLTIATRPELDPLLARIVPSVPRIGPPAAQPEAKMNLAALAGRFDGFVPFMTLPFLLGVTQPGPSAGSAPSPYLAADPARIAAWRARYDAALPGRRIVGVVWRASPTNVSSPRRSVPVEALAPLASQANVGFVNLQGGPAEGRDAIAPILPGMFDALADGEPALDDYAAAIAATDVLVTVDTMAAHLAGAMGHAALVLVPAEPHFYWGLGRNDCPWYPTLRLFRQAERGVWDDAVAGVAAALRGDLFRARA